MNFNGEDAEIGVDLSCGTVNINNFNSNKESDNGDFLEVWSKDGSLQTLVATPTNSF